MVFYTVSWDDILVFLDMRVLIYMIQSLCDSWQKLLELGGREVNCNRPVFKEFWNNRLKEDKK